MRLTDFRRHWVRSAIQTSLWWIALTTLFSALWIRHKFGTPTFNQFFFHVELGFHGLLTTEYYVVKGFMISCALIPGVIALAVSVMHRSKKLSLAAPAVSLFLSCIFLLNQVSFFAYAENQAGQDYFSAHYKNPARVTLAGKNPRNLVLIYVESLDAAYSNTKLFGKDLLHNLDTPALGGFSFARYSQAPGTEWTMAGIVSTQCGVPLEAVTLYDRNIQGEKIEHFLPSEMCLGDVLDEFGYRNVFMGGASLDFAGKGQFLKDHHYKNLYGRDEWIAEGEKPEDMSGWGLHDDDLFRHAKTEVDQLEASGGRFNLTMLTLDTHYSGTETLSKYCIGRGAKNFDDLVECTADQVADFVSYLRQKGYLNNTNVVILGDHLAMSNPDIDKLKEVSERHIFNLFVSNEAPKKRRDDLVHFDLFPTILDFIGIHAQKGQLALGYSAFSLSDPLPNTDRLAEMRRDLLHPSPLYFDLWKLPEETHRS